MILQVSLVAFVCPHPISHQAILHEHYALFYSLTTLNTVCKIFYVSRASACYVYVLTFRDFFSLNILMKKISCKIGVFAVDFAITHNSYVSKLWLV